MAPAAERILRGGLKCRCIREIRERIQRREIFALSPGRIGFQIFRIVGGEGGYLVLRFQQAVFIPPDAPGRGAGDIRCGVGGLFKRGLEGTGLEQRQK